MTANGKSPSPCGHDHEWGQVACFKDGGHSEFIIVRTLDLREGESPFLVVICQKCGESVYSAEVKAEFIPTDGPDAVH